MVMKNGEWCWDNHLRDLIFILLLNLGKGADGTRYAACVLISNSTHDLWFRPNPEPTDLKECLGKCRSADYRYGGYGERGCACGHGYGMGGSTIDCSRCQKYVDLMCGSANSFAVYDNYLVTLSAPQNLELRDKTMNALYIMWDPPGVPVGALRGYRVVATPVFSYGKEQAQVRSWEFLEPDLRSAYLITLSPATEYEVSLMALGHEGESKPIKRMMWTKIVNPDPPVPPKLIWHDGTRMKVSLNPTENSMGPVSFYRLAMIDESQLGFSSETTVVWRQARDLGYPYYITAQWNADDLPSTFIVGREDEVGGFFNGPLLEKGHWHPALGVGSTLDNVTKITYSSTGHEQHAHISIADGDVREIVITVGGGVLTALWIAVGITFTILLISLIVFLLLKFNVKPRSLRRRRREAHPLAHTNSSSQTPISTLPATVYDNFDGGGYTHLAFVNEEEDWGRKTVVALGSLHCIPRATINLPEDGDVDIRQVADGVFGPVFSSTWDEKKVHLYQHPSASIPKTSNSRSWDEEMYRALDALIKPVSHINIVSLNGFVQSDKQLYFVTPAYERVLKTELMALRTQAKKNPQSLILCAMGVAEGLFHLHSYGLTHGHLCAWNVVLPCTEGGWENPKITGLGIIQSHPRSKVRDRTRWMSVEELHSRCVPPSDSWAFGVLLWEIASLGGTPLEDIRTEDVKRRVERGARPAQLTHMGDGLYQIMLTCWQLDRDERPDGGTLACELHQLLPRANEELGLEDSQAYSPYNENLEFLPSTN